MLEFFQGLLTAFSWIWSWIWNWIQEHPKYMGLVALGVVGLMGTLIETGKRGVLYHFGRAKRVLEPGFHFLIPGLQKVKKVHMRDRTLDLFAQRVTSQDGVVYRVDSSLLFRICNPILASVNIDDLKKGCETILALRIQKVLKEKTWLEMQQKEILEEEILKEVSTPLFEWGVEVIRVGFTSISPSPASLPLTQLRLRVQQKQQLFQYWQQEKLSTKTSLFLLGTEPFLLTSRSHERYRSHKINLLKIKRLKTRHQKLFKG